MNSGHSRITWKEVDVISLKGGLHLFPAPPLPRLLLSASLSEPLCSAIFSECRCLPHLNLTKHNFQFYIPPQMSYSRIELLYCNFKDWEVRLRLISLGWVFVSEPISSSQGVVLQAHCPINGGPGGSLSGSRDGKAGRVLALVSMALLCYLSVFSWNIEEGSPSVPCKPEKCHHLTTWSPGLSSDSIG